MDASITRRDMLKNVGLAAGTLAVLGCNEAGGQATRPAAEATRPSAEASAKAYSLPSLAYAYDALEPHIDAQTLRLHHEKHHAGYVQGLNTALERLEAAARSGDTEQVQYWSRDAAFHGSGHVLHTLYWANMKPGGGRDKKAGGAIARLIERQFGSYEGFAGVFAAVTKAVPGSGWGVLGFEPTGGRLVIAGVEKHENVNLAGMRPLLVCDVWEHAYYLKYQNRRAEYVDAFMKHLVDWDEVNRRLEAV